MLTTIYLYYQQNRGIYMFRLDDNRIIDATLQGGLARYVNHSCDPNCVTDCVQIDREIKILIIANRKIQKGEEVSDNFFFLKLELIKIQFYDFSVHCIDSFCFIASILLINFTFFSTYSLSPV